MLTLTQKFQFPSNGKAYLNYLLWEVMIVETVVSIPFKRESISERKCRFK